MQTRFAFGRNWRNYSRRIDETTLERAETSLVRLLGRERLDDCRFLDAGSGSGLFSLAARRLGAEVVSFDYDAEAVGCTLDLRDRYRRDDPGWRVAQGSLLDEGFMAGLGRFEIVYSWGVVHHTGDLWRALRNLAGRVEPGGTLALAIYNDQGSRSERWRRVKELYNRTRGPARAVVLGAAFLRLWGPTFVRDLLRFRPLQTWSRYGEERGMSPWYDVVDWVGGLPFEVARPEAVVEACRRAGFELRELKTCGGGHGCNEYVFLACGSAS